MSLSTESIHTIAREANQEDVPLKVDIGSLRLQDDDVEEKKKKRKNRRSKKRATGFEEFYCDPPMTPAQYQEEHEVVYPPHRPFVNRIEECIQRFRALRRMDNTQDSIFSAYLLLGGVDSRQRQFQGTSKLNNAALEGYTKAEVRDITADDVIPRGQGATDIRFYNPSSPEHWNVDFTAVASGFLSEHLSGLHSLDTIEYQKGVAVVLNFLKYVVSHDVCPEYADDLRRAQKVCVAALEEAQAIFDLMELLPGTFNLAGNTLLDGTLETDFDPEWALASKPPLDKEAALTILLAHGSVLLDNSNSERLQKALSDPNARIAKGTGCFEIVGIMLPSKAAIAQLEIATECMNQHFKQDLSLEACGRLVVRPTFVRSGWQVTAASGVPVMTTLDGKYTTAKVPEFFFVELEALETFKIGMKMQIQFLTLEDGLVNFISRAENIYQSFYAFLPQELMIRYKEPRLNERPAKSIHDVDGGDGAGDDIPFDD